MTKEQFLAKNDFKTPLLFPVRCNADCSVIEVLDETRLPWEEVYIGVRDLSDAEEVLYLMKTRAFGQVLLFLYTCAQEALRNPGQPVPALINAVAQAFKNKRPTFDFVSIGGLLQSFAAKQPQRPLLDVVRGFIGYFDAGRKKRALALAQALPAQASIMTVCNVNGELVYLFYALKAFQKTAQFYVTETRPYLQGSRLTFYELQRSGIPAVLLCDNQAAAVMKQRYVNAVVTGADRANKKGDIINKIGTYALARLAAQYQIPFYVYTQYPIDIDIERIPIEQRPAEEVFMYCDTVPHQGQECVYPNFDITLHEYITGWVTPDGLKLRG